MEQRDAFAYISRILYNLYGLTPNMKMPQPQSGEHPFTHRPPLQGLQIHIGHLYQ
jgi:hypothetical protein